MQRVDLVRKVCAAVQSAHQKLLIHRDIKPSNILVDSAGEPKLLDFGIARLLEDDPHAHDLTQGGLLFTPRYASPEQVRGEPVSVATDVYGLGALLYELLAGSSPYARIANTDAGNAAALMRVVAEDKIEQPDILAQTFQPSFSKILSGDLGRILTTACAKEPSDRYPTVAALAADLDRWREGKPIDARPHSWPYIAAKFVGRHRVGTALGVFALAAIAAGVAGTIVQKNRAEQRYAQVRQIPNRVIFKYYDLIENLAGSTPVRRAMVKDALTFLDELAADSINDSQLAIEIATGYRKMGEVMFNGRNMASLGDREGGDAARAKAEKVLLSILARDPANVPALREMAHVDADIGAVMGSTGKGDEAIRRFDLATERYHQALNASPRDSDLRFDLIRNLAATAQSSINAGRSAASYLAAAEREFADWEKTQPANDVHVDNLRMLLIRTQYRQAGEIEQDIPRAIGFADREIELLDKLSAIDPDNATLWQHKQVGLMNSGALLIDQQRPEEALVRLLKAEPLSQRLRESDKENINFVGGQARLFTHKGRALSQLGRRAEAIAAFSESVRMWESLGKGEPLPYMRRQQGQAYYLLAREYAKSADLLRARAEAKRFLAYAARYPDLFAKPPAIEWIADARTLAG
jgi:non-specific serine/threonine protein kinase/serine/threonine-protein kinase